MNITIVSPTSRPIPVEGPEHEHGLGGADQTLLKMIFTLTREHKIKAYIPTERTLTTHKLEIIPWEKVQDNKDPECDVYINYRTCHPLYQRAKKYVFYSQDDINTPCFNNITPDYFKPYHKIIVLSHYHKERLVSHFDLDPDKITIIGNAANPQPVIEKVPGMCIYASTPYRGLPVLARMWRKIIQINPQATLHVFSSMKIYGATNIDEATFQPLYDKLKTIPGIIYHGSRPHAEVIAAMNKAELLLYPNTYPETYCNVIMEARASHTPFITTLQGALKETGGYAGTYIEGNPYTEEYQDKFIEAYRIITKIREVYERRVTLCYPIRTWEDYATDILRAVKQ